LSDPNEKAMQFFMNFSYITFHESCSVVLEVLHEG